MKVPLRYDFESFTKAILPVCPDRVFTDFLHCYAYGVDASCYSYVPKVVVKANSEAEVIRILHYANQYGTPVTFRAAGTSLSGQCSSEHVLVVANDGFKTMDVLDGGKALRCDCGVIGSDANEKLAPYGRKIGPDPATITSALVGGIFNNNSSGMCCGTVENSYKTVKSIRVVLVDGTVLDTSDAKSIQDFLVKQGDLVKGLEDLRAWILDDPELVDLIHRKYKIKNTTGYGINSLVDFDNIVDILNHIFIGSEGTLGFVSEVVYHTVEDKKYKGCGLVFYEKLTDASRAVVTLAGMSRKYVVSAEMMDYLSLKSVQNLEQVPDFVKDVPEGTSCILFQSESNDEKELQEQLAYIKDQLKDIPTAIPSLYSTNAEEYNGWWYIRKGLLPIAAGQRRSGSTVITEDVCFKIEDFVKGIEMITELFHTYGFVENGIIFGHALSGNVHFIITPDLNNPVERENFSNLVKEMSERVAAVEGSIKAEHGTGRMVAPFVELEWGVKAYQVNRRIKELFDPTYLINPDVIITDDPDMYKKNLKAMAAIDPLYNMCIECGFCEKNCPSKNITLTPRQRISLVREETRLRQEGKIEEADALAEGYQYYGVKTCAACSMCSMLCPLGIDTAHIALSMRKITAKGEGIARAIYDNFPATLAAARMGVTLGGAAGKVVTQKLISKITQSAYDVTGVTPYAPTTLPKANRHTLRSKRNTVGSQNVVYFSTCANRAFKPNQGQKDTRSLQQVMESLCEKAGYNIIYPPHIENLCCGLSFENYEDLDKRALHDLETALLEASCGGVYPVVIDHSACFSHAFKHIKSVTIFDVSEFLYTHIVPHLEITKCKERVLVHKQCKIKKVGKEKFIELIARACTDTVFNIKSFACCGFAGQKGFFTPELNESATRDLASEAKSYGVTLGVSSSSTCEIGLGEKSGIPFIGIAYLLDACSRGTR